MANIFLPPSVTDAVVKVGGICYKHKQYTPLTEPDTFVWDGYTSCEDCQATPTPTLTSTPTETPTLTLTSTPTETPTLTLTSTPTETPTLTLTSTPTETPTLTPTPTPTETPTLTPTPTETPTETPTLTIMLTPTPTPTPTVEPPAPLSCPCTDPWPPASWPCGGLNQTYSISYRLRCWNNDSCSGAPAFDGIVTVTATASFSGSCWWTGTEVGAGVWTSDVNLILNDVPGNWSVARVNFPTAYALKSTGLTPVGGYTSAGCIGSSMFGQSSRIDDVIVSAI